MDTLTPATQFTSTKKQKSIGKGYLYLIFTGVFGGHRFYLGHYLLGILYFMTLGVFGLGLIIDLFRLPSLIEAYNTQTEEQLEHDAELSADEAPHPELNPFAARIKIWRWSKYFLYFCFIIMAPYLFYSFFDDLVFVGVILTLYAFIAFNKSIKTLLGKTQFIVWKIPGVRNKLLEVEKGMAKLRHFYVNNPPGNMFKSIFSIFIVPFSAKARKEWKLFNSLVSFGILFTIFEVATWVREYFTVYQPELTLTNLLTTKLALIVTSAVVTLMIVIPVIRTLLCTELSGQTKTGPWFVVLSIIGLIAFISSEATEHYGYENYQRLSTRVKESRLFQNKFNPVARHFLMSNFKTSTFNQFVTDDGQKPAEHRLGNMQLALNNSIELTRRFRTLLVNQKLVRRDEVDGFRILAFIKNDNGRWHPGLLLYIGYGTSEGESSNSSNTSSNRSPLPWYRLYNRRGFVELNSFISVKNVDDMYNILLTRMQAMGKGDLLAPTK